MGLKCLLKFGALSLIAAPATMGTVACAIDLPPGLIDQFLPDIIDFTDTKPEIIESQRDFHSNLVEFYKGKYFGITDFLEDPSKDNLDGILTPLDSSAFIQDTQDTQVPKDYLNIILLDDWNMKYRDYFLINNSNFNSDIDEEDPENKDKIIEKLNEIIDKDQSMIDFYNKMLSTNEDSDFLNSRLMSDIKAIIQMLDKIIPVIKEIRDNLLDKA